MRDFAECPQFAFREYSQTFCPAYDETYRTRQAETHSTSFFCWTANTARNDQNSLSPQTTFTDTDGTESPLFPSFFSDTPNNIPVASNQVDADAPYNSITDYDFSTLASILMDSGQADTVKIKEEQDMMSISNRINFSDASGYPYGSDDITFPSFREDIKPLVPEESQANTDPFQLFSRTQEVESEPVKTPTSTNLEKIIDECISLESSFNSGEYEVYSEGEQRCSCKWTGCELVFSTQDLLVSFSWRVLSTFLMVF